MPSSTVPALLVIVALSATSWPEVLKVAVARAAAVLVAAVPIEKVPSTESVEPLVGAGESVSFSRLSSKMAVVVVWMFCNRLMTDVPFAADGSR